MPAFNFMAKYAGPVERGEKRTTIRAWRKDGRVPCREGDHLKHYTGMRSKSCRLLCEARCLAISPIFIAQKPRAIYWSKSLGGIWHYRHTLLSPKATRVLIERDGFDDEDEFYQFFDRGDGRYWLIKWLPFAASDSDTGEK